MPWLRQEPYPFFVIRDDAADEVWARVSQGGHQLGQLLLVQLPHCPEHALLGLGSAREGAFRHLRHLVQPHNPVH